MKSISIAELKKIQLDILTDIHHFCIKNNLKYTLAYGSLLGAVRHKGFIPWDDDIDIAMLRSDYDFLIQNYSHDYYKVYDLRTCENYHYAFAKIADIRTTIEEDVNMSHIGINIDIFPVDDLCNTKEESYSVVSKMMRNKKMFRMKLLRPVENMKWWKKIGLYLGGWVSTFWSMGSLAWAIHKQATSINNPQSRYVGMLVGTRIEDTYKEIVPRTWYENLIDMEFENCTFRCTRYYDEYLTQEYGDYMCPPPPKELRSPHTIVNAYWNS